MLLGTALNSALKAMSANQLALAVAANNIANANNPDYSRQRLVMQPGVPDAGAFGIGSGVDVLGVVALRDALVESRLSHELSAKSNADTLAQTLSNIETRFNDANGTGLLQQITDFFNSFQTLSTDPASPSFREQIRITANTLIQSFHNTAEGLTQAKMVAEKAVNTSISEVNRLTTQIADLTRKIKIEEVTMPANDLRDRRTALVKELSQYIEVSVVETGTQYQLTTKNDRLLVLNEVTRALPSDVGPEVGGSLGAQIELRDTYIPKYAAALDDIAYQMAQQVNSIHSAAYGLDGNTGVNFFTPVSLTGAASNITLSTDVAGNARMIAASNDPTGNDNGAAIAIGQLLRAPVFAGGASITDQYGSLVFSVGTDVANANFGVDEHQALITQLQNRRQSVSGVSIDEEAAQILQFQRAFQASAHLVQTIDKLLGTLLGE
jgi:flagellar hook-associated protein 1 FlgK